MAARKSSTMREPTAVDSIVEVAPPFVRPSLRLLLFGLQSPINIGMILRVAETYRARVGLVDSHGVLADPETRKTVSDFSTGALDRRPPTLIEPEAGLTGVRFAGRLIATSLGPGAEPLPRFRFEQGDVVAIGNEYDGLPPELIASAEARLIIPMPEGAAPKPKSFSPIDVGRQAQVANAGAPNLNAAMSAGVIAYAAWLQTLDPEHFE